MIAPTNPPTDRFAHARAVRMRQTAEARAADPSTLAKAVRTVVAGAPTLSAEQADQLRSLLPPAGSEREPAS